MLCRRRQSVVRRCVPVRPAFTAVPGRRLLAYGCAARRAGDLNFPFLDSATCDEFVCDYFPSTPSERIPLVAVLYYHLIHAAPSRLRSEERRVGKECS